MPGQCSPHNGSQAGNPGAAQEREKGGERELNMEGKELNNLGLVSSPLSLYRIKESVCSALGFGLGECCGWYV